VTAAVSSSPARGLSAAEARRRLLEHGPNALPEAARTPGWLRFARQFRSPLVLLLLFALALDLATWLIAGADGFCGALTAGTLLTPGLREALGLVPLAAELWTLVLAAVAATWLGAELLGRAVDRSAAQPASSPRS
jgi:magnesium-transporting ATPase (P-type)